MGFIDTSTLLAVTYNVVHAVGVYCPNHRDDVKMVQYLLLCFYGNKKAKFPKPQGKMTVDGFCGGITLNWIKKFQTDLMFANHSIVADGRVDRIRDTKKLEGSISKTCYTLAWLDWYVAELAPEEYAALPMFVPLMNPLNVPPPSVDIVKPTVPPPELSIPAKGGIFGSIFNIPATGGV